MDRIGILNGVATRVLAQLTPPAVSQTPAPAGHEQPPNPVPAASVVRQAKTELSSFAVLWQAKDQALGRVQDIAAQRRVLARAGEITAGIERQIEALVKNYPPFPPGSEERLSYLRSISSLRQQLDALTLPPATDAPIPPPPPMPSEAASDAQWQEHAKALADYRGEIGRVQAALGEQIQRTKLWPELAGETDAAGIWQDMLPPAVQGLAHAASAITPSGAMARSGLT